MLVAKRVSTTVKPRPEKQDAAFLIPVSLSTDCASPTRLPTVHHSSAYSLIHSVPQSLSPSYNRYLLATYYKI